MGDYDTHIHIPYSKGEKLDIGDSWIEDMSGNIIRKLKNKEITDQSYISDISLYEDEFVKSFELKHNDYPYRVVFSYKKTISKFCNILLLDCRERMQPITHRKVVVKAPTNYPIKYKQLEIDPPQISSIKNIRTYTWEFSYKPVIAEKNKSYNTLKAPQLYVVPLNFKYGLPGSMENWETFGNWNYRLNQNRDLLPESEKIIIDKLLNGVGNEREKAEILYYYLQDNTRYINVKFDVGGLRTYPAEYVCKNRYGDCKALTNYMKSILKYAGINSIYTLIDSGDDIMDIDPDFPVSRFNHAILTIPFDNDTVYLECTSRNTPFGYVSTNIQGRKALLILEEGSYFTKLPSLKGPDVKCSRYFDVVLNSTHNVKCDLKSVERGEYYEYYTAINTNLDKNTVDKYIRNYVLSGSYEIEQYSFEKADRDSSLIELNINCKFSNLYKEYGNNYIINPFPLFIPSYETPEKRQQEVQINYPRFYCDTITYILPYKTISKIPEDIKIETPFGHYRTDYKVEGDKLKVFKSVLILAGRHSLSEYPDFYNFMNTVKNIENKNIYIEVL